jgi:hypothetical protein
MDVFNEYGVQIMSPHYMVDPAQPHVVPKDQWFAAPAKPPAPTSARIREPSSRRGDDQAA